MRTEIVQDVTLEVAARRLAEARYAYDAARDRVAEATRQLAAAQDALATRRREYSQAEYALLELAERGILRP